VHGCFLSLSRADYGGAFEAAWDRGALTSVPDAARYAAALARALAPGAPALIELLCSDAAAHGAAREADAARALRAAGLSVQRLAARCVLRDYPDCGLPSLQEVVLLATRPR
jgi:hypothetical protein